MAHGMKPATATMAPTPTAVHSSNGSNAADTAAGVNRKKAKRRAKGAAKRKAEQGHSEAGNTNVNNGHPPHSSPKTSNTSSAPQNSHAAAEYEDDGYSNRAVYNDEPYYSENDPAYNHQYNPGYANGDGPGHRHIDSSHEQAKKKRKGKLPPQPPYSHPHHHQYPAGTHSHVPPPPPPPPPAMSSAASRTVQKNSKGDRIWNTSTQEERERIKDFWLSLKEEERKSLVKIEKEAVLRKMEEQQKHSRSCTVYRRKRTAIEEELEVLYDAYYEELETYAIKGIPYAPLLVGDVFPRPLFSSRNDQITNRLPSDHMPLPVHAGWWCRNAQVSQLIRFW
jgi:hypothetical protein